MDIFTSLDNESCHKALKNSGSSRVAFVYHLKIKDPNDYKKWLNESENSFSGKRLYRVKAELPPIKRTV